MSADDFASSVQGLMARITPLTADGAVDTNKRVLTTKGFIRAAFTPEYEDGDEINEKAANGEVCITWKGDDSFKRVGFALQLCTPDPEATTLLTGGDIIWDGTDIIGYASPAVGSVSANPVTIEVWSYANIGGKPASGGTPYWHWIFPYVKVRFDGEREFANGALGNEFSGWGVGNDGLLLDQWPYDGIDRPFAYVRAAALPTPGWSGTTPTPPGTEATAGTAVITSTGDNVQPTAGAAQVLNSVRANTNGTLWIRGRYAWYDTGVVIEGSVTVRSTIVTSDPRIVDPGIVGVTDNDVILFDRGDDYLPFMYDSTDTGWDIDGEAFDKRPG